MRSLLGAAIISGALIGAGSAALAADLPVKARPMGPVETVTNWTGCYVGAAGGGIWGRESVTSATTTAGATVTSINPTGALIGGTVGCNYQTGNFVLGLEGDLSWTSLRGSAGDLPPFNTAFSHSVRTNWMDTARARVGYSWNRTLLYVTGGGAFTGIQDSATGPGIAATQTTSRAGWVAGGGIEYMIAPDWSAKIEYLYADFGTVRDAFETVPPAGTLLGVNTRLTESVVRAGINWHFNWGGPVVARY